MGGFPLGRFRIEPDFRRRPRQLKKQETLEEQLLEARRPREEMKRQAYNLIRCAADLTA